jgi:hypothetical protein
LCSSSSSLAEAEAAAPAAAKLFPIPFELHLSSFVGTLLGKHSTSDDEERSLQPEEAEQEELDWEQLKTEIKVKIQFAASRFDLLLESVIRHNASRRFFS